tara:strand:- start:1606 stop:1848 length:243 start_codon:yes stop_codon:yes gene_type:complete
MFGILEKMDKFSNAQMGEDEKIDFIQEIVDTGMVWDMHEKYISQAEKYLNAGNCVDMVLYRRQPDELEEHYQAARLAGEC